MSQCMPQQLDVPLLEGGMIGNTGEEPQQEDEEMDLLEIIQEGKIADTTNHTVSTINSDTFDDSTTTRPSISHEFSLSSLGSALAGTLQASTTSLGTATASLHSKGVEKLLQSFNQLQVASPRELGQTSEHGATVRRVSDSSMRGTGGRGLRAKFSGKQPARKVDFGEFEHRAARLQYTQEDIFNITNDPAQMKELRLALRSLGAVTNTTLKQKLHWYVKNSKRARRDAEERARQQEEGRARKLEKEQARQQQLEERRQAELEPSTPPIEYNKVIDGNKVLQDAAGVLSPDDPSPKSVRDIFVPPS